VQRHAEVDNRVIAPAGEGWPRRSDEIADLGAQTDQARQTKINAPPQSNTPVVLCRDEMFYTS